MIKIAEFLQEHYYTKYAGCPAHLIPDNDTLVKALDIHQDKVVVVRDGEEILGVAVFLKLTDETYNNIETFDMSNQQVLHELLQENGDNLHFILVAGNDYENIREGIRMVKPLHPKTVSWWNPDNSHLHKFSVR